MALFNFNSSPLIVGKSKGKKMPNRFKSFRSSDPELIYDPSKTQYQLEAKSPYGVVAGIVGQGARPKKVRSARRTK